MSLASIHYTRARHFSTLLMNVDPLPIGSILDRLKALGPRVQILHGIDALDIKGTLLENSGSLLSFDHIIFNHPHTGWEDCNRHAALIAHFFET